MPNVKRENLVVTNTRLPRGLHKSLKLEAKRRGISFNDLVTERLAGHEMQVAKQVADLAQPLLDAAVTRATAAAGNTAAEMLLAAVREMVPLSEAKLGYLEGYLAGVNFGDAREFEAYAEVEDKAFAEATPESNDPERLKALRDAVFDVLTKDLGFTEDEVEQHWNSNPLLRDRRFQAVFARLGRQRLARIKAIKALQARAEQHKKLVTGKPAEVGEK